MSKLDKMYSNRPKLIKISAPPPSSQFPDQMAMMQMQYNPIQQQMYPGTFPQQYQSDPHFYPSSQQQTQYNQPFQQPFPEYQNFPFTNQPPQQYPPQYYQQTFPQQNHIFPNQTLQQVPQQQHLPYYQTTPEQNFPFQAGGTQQMQQPHEQNPEENERQSNHEDDKSANRKKNTKGKFNKKKMLPPPPPPPEMIQALLGLILKSQDHKEEEIQYIAPPAAQENPLSYLNPNLLRGNINDSKIKLSSYVFKNQNAPDAPLNPKFYKMPTKQHDTSKEKEKEKLYKPNTGYIIEDEEGESFKKDEKEKQEMNIIIRGEDDIIKSGVTTEQDDEEEKEDQLNENITPADRQYINQKYLLSESITESQFKEEVPKVYVDPKQACDLEELKIEENEKAEDEFQRKKEALLLKSKYKILAEIEKDKSRKLMEKLLGKELEELESKNKHLEKMSKIEGEDITKQKEQVKDLEKIIKDIREERDYKTIKKVLGIEVDRPVDEIIDMDKIKADYEAEEMFKRNEQLYQEAEQLLRDCHFYVDEEGKQHDDYLKKVNPELNISIDKFSRHQDEEDNDYYFEDNSNIQSNIQSLNNSKLYQSNLVDSRASINNLRQSKVRFENGNNKSKRITSSSNRPPSKEEIQMREYYSRIKQKTDELSSKLSKLCYEGEPEEEQVEKEIPNYAKITGSQRLKGEATPKEANKSTFSRQSSRDSTLNQSHKNTKPIQQSMKSSVSGSQKLVATKKKKQ